MWAAEMGCSVSVRNGTVLLIHFTHRPEASFLKQQYFYIS